MTPVTVNLPGPGRISQRPARSMWEWFPSPRLNILKTSESGVSSATNRALTPEVPASEFRRRIWRSLATFSVFSGSTRMRSLA